MPSIANLCLRAEMFEKVDELTLRQGLRQRKLTSATSDPRVNVVSFWILSPVDKQDQLDQEKNERATSISMLSNVDATAALKEIILNSPGFVQ